MLRFSPRALAAGSLLLVLALVPLYAQWQGEPFCWRCSAGCWCTASPRWP